MKQLQLSVQMHKDITTAVEKCADRLKECLDIGSFNSIRVSIDLNPQLTGKECGIKISICNIEQAELIYEKDLK